MALIYTIHIGEHPSNVLNIKTADTTRKILSIVCLHCHNFIIRDIIQQEEIKKEIENKNQSEKIKYIYDLTKESNCCQVCNKNKHNVKIFINKKSAEIFMKISPNINEKNMLTVDDISIIFRNLNDDVKTLLKFL